VGVLQFVFLVLCGGVHVRDPVGFAMHGGVLRCAAVS
jgi:hypothetical protein